MAKSLKEALLEKFADLQELGIAPTTAPVEDDRPPVVVEMGPDNYGDGGRRRGGNRGGMYDDDRRGLDMPFRARANRGGGAPPGRGGRGGERGGERGRGGPPGGGERFRRPDRGGERAALEGMPSPLTGPRPPFSGGPGGPRPPFADRPAGPRPPFGGGPGGPGGPRPPFGDRGPRPGGPGGPPMAGRPGGPPMGVDPRAQQMAERRRREAGQRDELLALIATHTGAEATPEVFDKFLADLTVETGALPDVGRVLDAVKLAKSIEAVKVGNAVRHLFRRPRPRPAGAPVRSAAPAAPARSAAPAPPAAPVAPTAAPAPEAPTASSAPAPEAPTASSAPEAPTASSAPAPEAPEAVPTES